MLTTNLDTSNKVELSMNTRDKEIILVTQTITNNNQQAQNDHFGGANNNNNDDDVTTTTITKTRTMAGTTKIMYQKTIQIIMHYMMIIMSVC